MINSTKKDTEHIEANKAIKSTESPTSNSLDLATMELSLNIGGVALKFVSDQWRPESTDLHDAATVLHTIMDVRILLVNSSILSYEPMIIQERDNLLAHLTESALKIESIQEEATEMNDTKMIALQMVRLLLQAVL